MATTCCGVSGMKRRGIGRCRDGHVIEWGISQRSRDRLGGYDRRGHVVSGTLLSFLVALGGEEEEPFI